MKDLLRVYVCLGIGHRIPKVVLESISSQTVQTEVIQSVSEPSTNSVSLRLNLNRNKCRDLALATGDEFAVICDRDLRHRFEDNFKLMRQFLKDNQDFGGVNLLKHEGEFIQLYFTRYPMHICDSCCMLRKAALKDADWNLDPTAGSCTNLSNSLYNAGWKYGYLDGIVRVDHLNLSGYTNLEG